MLWCDEKSMSNLLNILLPLPFLMKCKQTAADVLSAGSICITVAHMTHFSAWHVLVLGILCILEYMCSKYL